MTARADAAQVEADLESARQALRAGVAYLAAVTRKGQGLRAVDRVVLPTLSATPFASCGLR
jgi:hypothetical protein